MRAASTSRSSGLRSELTLALQTVAYSLLRPEPTMQAVPHFGILLSLPPECWNYRRVPPYQVYRVLEIISRASCMVDKLSTN